MLAVFTEMKKKKQTNKQKKKPRNNGCGKERVNTMKRHTILEDIEGVGERKKVEERHEEEHSRERNRGMKMNECCGKRRTSSVW